jgi:RNA 2',3'-cyclic 3'-phosphodiesterase
VAAIARAFVAVEPPPAVRDALGDRVQAVRDRSAAAGLRFATSWHVTLQFLGRVDDGDELAGALTRALAGAEPPFVRLGGAGAFPRTSRGTSLWIGVEEGAEELGRIASTVMHATEPLGFVADARRFQPHVTLARSRTARDLRALVDALGVDPVGAGWRVDAAVLLASDTRPDGARYTEVSRIPLAR